MRTYVYDLSGPGWFPTTPENARMAWTAVGLTSLTGVSTGASQLSLRTWVTPNPASGSCALGFSLPTPGKVALSVFDAQGRLVRQLVVAYRGKGTHSAIWDLRDLDRRPVASGVYFYRLRSNSGESIGKIAVLR
jgi:Secretion system C-terminal sorting domain